VWIGITFIAMVGIFLVWSLFKGRIVLTLGLYIHPETRTIDRETSPKTFWAVWTVTAAGLSVFTFFFIRTVWS
jgi:hypothetical protein